MVFVPLVPLMPVEIKFFGRYKGGAIDDGVVMAIGTTNAAHWPRGTPVMNVLYRHGLIAGFFGGWAFGTLTTGYLAIMSILLVILAALVFSDYWRGIASDTTEHEP